MNSPEEIWEKTMKEVIGEDGPKSVAEAIRRLQAELDRERIARIRAQQQLQSYQDDQKASGLCIRYALNGKSRSEDRWWMGEMDRVRDLAADRDALAARVERLERAVTPSIIAFARCGIGANYSGEYYNHTINQYIKPLEAALAEPKPAALSRVRAEAVREAKMDFIVEAKLYGGPSTPYMDGLCEADRQWNDHLESYAQRIINEAEGGEL